MPRPRLPSVPHEDPSPGEPSFACKGPCGLLWPIRLRLHHPSYCPNCLRGRKRGYASREVNRRTHLRSKYRVTPEWVDEQLAAQGGECPICACALSLPSGKPGVRKGEAVVDHHHGHGRVRGLLCNRCNVAIGMLDDDVDRLRRAAAYLKKYTMTPEEVDAHLARVSSGQTATPRRVPTVPEERHSPDESIDSIVARMGAEIIDAPLLPSPKGKR